MSRRAFRSILGGTGAGVVTVSLIGAFFFLSRHEGAQEAVPPIELFSAPSELPPGEHWVIVGHGSELPADFALSVRLSGVSVLETQRLSKRAVAARILVPAVGVGNLLRATSVTAGIDQEVAIQKGVGVPALSRPTNFTADDFAAGRLTVRGNRFVYGYFPATAGGISALRIHNRARGSWHRREIARERAIQAARPPAVLPPNVVEVDPLDTLPDTDGDGILDFDEPEVESPRPDFVGVRLEPGLNTLDIVAVDEAGNASWETIDVFTTYTPRVKNP